jgi:hypothetical protein
VLVNLIPSLFLLPQLLEEHPDIMQQPRFRAMLEYQRRNRSYPITKSGSPLINLIKYDKNALKYIRQHQHVGYHSDRHEQGLIRVEGRDIAIRDGRQHVDRIVQGEHVLDLEGLEVEAWVGGGLEDPGLLVYPVLYDGLGQGVEQQAQVVAPDQLDHY